MRVPMIGKTEFPLRHRPRIRSRALKQGGGDVRQKIMVMLIPVLVCTLYALVKNHVGAPGSTQAANTQPTTSPPRTRPAVEITWVIPPLYESNGRDPMRLRPPAPESHETAALPAQTYVSLLLTGILHSDDRPAAVVNTQVVYEGQQISGATVLRIEKDSVEFERNGRKWTQAVGE